MTAEQLVEQFALLRQDLKAGLDHVVGAIAQTNQRLDLTNQRLERFIVTSEKFQRVTLRKLEGIGSYLLSIDSHLGGQ